VNVIGHDLQRFNVYIQLICFFSEQFFQSHGYVAHKYFPPVLWTPDQVIFERKHTASVRFGLSVRHRTIVLQTDRHDNFKSAEGVAPATSKFPCRLKKTAPLEVFMEPDVLRCHAAGRGDDFLHGLNMDATLRQITCPTLLLRADPKLGALLSAEASAHGASLLDQGDVWMIKGVEHSLGMDGDVESLLRVVEEFLERIRAK
jgi:hypothetical protein